MSLAIDPLMATLFKPMAFPRGEQMVGGKANEGEEPGAVREASEEATREDVSGDTVGGFIVGEGAVEGGSREKGWRVGLRSLEIGKK